MIRLRRCGRGCGGLSGSSTCGPCSRGADVSQSAGPAGTFCRAAEGENGFGCCRCPRNQIHNIGRGMTGWDRCQGLELGLAIAERIEQRLIDEEWEILQPIFAELEPYTTGRPRTTDLREILNAIFYLNKAGCPWRYLPTDFPPYRLVNYYDNKWTDNRTLEKVNTALRQNLREKKVETQTRRQPSLTVKASRESQNPIWNQGSREASSLKEEKAISLSIQWVV